MEGVATAVLSYALWPVLTLAIIALWVAAILDITHHRRKGTSTNAGLLFMTTLVSVVAVIAVAGLSAVLAAQWTEAVSRASLGEVQSNKLKGEGSARTYIFSFGLENASYGSLVDAKGSHNRAAR
jgi:predicted PurR-regulated permease PerM